VLPNLGKKGKQTFLEEILGVGSNCFFLSSKPGKNMNKILMKINKEFINKVIHYGRSYSIVTKIRYKNPQCLKEEG